MGRIVLISGLVLFVLWLAGMISSFTLRGGIHILLVAAVILFIVWLIMGRGTRGVR